MEDLLSSSLIKSVNQIPTITICTDASFDNDLKRGAWACYIRGDKFRIREARIITREVNNSTEAERVGVAAALWILRQKVEIKNYRLILYCDNESAMMPVRTSNKTGRKKQRAKQELDFYHKNIQRYLQKAKSYEIRHVKGHMSRSKRLKMQRRHHIQDWCDRAARGVLNKLRDEIRKGDVEFAKLHPDGKFSPE